MVTTGIVAHVDRFDAASKLGTEVGAHYMLYDSGELGCRANHVRVWDRLAGVDTPWVLVLEDDAIPVEGFRIQLDMALAEAPSPIVSLYLGTGNPGHWQKPIRRALAKADVAQAHWAICTHLLHGVGVAMRTELVHDMLRYIRAYPNAPIDEAITRYAIAQQHSIAYTVPSLCDHADEPTLIARHPDRQPRHRPRVAWCTGSRDEWSSAAIRLAF